MTKKRLGMGLVGPGFIAEHHLDAVRRLGDVNIIGIAGSSEASAQAKAHKLNAGRAFRSYEELVNDPSVDVVHNTTPNHLHLPVSLAALRAGKHVISDKPLALTPAECLQLCRAAAEAGVVGAVTFNYRGNPLVQHARQLIALGELGALTFVHGHYLQDWMTSPDVFSWRMDPEKGGASSALADIGSHWCDLAEHTTGMKIVSVLTEMTTVVRTRYSSGSSAEAFAIESGLHPYAVDIRGEDLAVVLLRFENGAIGSLKVGQVLPGHKNDLVIEWNGRKASFRWSQEVQNELWIGNYQAPNGTLMKDPALLDQAAKTYAHLPAGHQESWADAFRNVIADIYSFIRSGGEQNKRPATVCTFDDAYRTSRIIDAMLRSYADGGVWRDVDADPVRPVRDEAMSSILGSHD